MLRILFRSHRLTKKRILTSYQGEVRQWKADFKASIAKHREDFWEFQTGVENDWINSYNKALMKKYHKRSCSNREAVINISKNTTYLQKLREENAKKKESNLKALADKYADDFLRKKELIDVLNLESKDWINLNNYKEKITPKLILPDNLDTSSYYVRVRETALIAGFGKHHPNDNAYNNRQETMIKNSVLIPIFTELKVLIKKLTYTPIWKLYEDFEGVKGRLYDHPDKIKEIAKKYENLAQAWIDLEKNNLEIYLDRLYTRLQDLEKTCRLWNKYIGVAKMDDTEIRMVHSKISDKEVITEVADENEPWEKDFEDQNPETSDAFTEDVHVEKEEFKEQLEKEQFKEQLEKDDISIMSDEVMNFSPGTESEPATDFDMYSGKKVEIVNDEPSLRSLENVMDDLIKNLNDSKELFQIQGDFDDNDLEDATNIDEFSPVFSIMGLKKKIENIDGEKLDPQTKSKKNEVLRIIDNLNHCKIDEPHMMIKVWKHHRYGPAVFK
ncbi:hypothetical protein SteCoe_28894 [Stentor coeruleus]|uniref:Uncharacterized protein n=1 Tax=Stentor coeruleus TaxID=5963 RepID=A0A1R2B766_9CILI|nr:hypothetical protein SteCoe_28894 [Stentor coeruleus]